MTAQDRHLYESEKNTEFNEQAVLNLEEIRTYRPQEKMHRTSLDIPKRLHNLLRREAFEKETTIAQIIRQELEDRYSR